jgi:FixJ family two-component response regulator
MSSPEDALTLAKTTTEDIRLLVTDVMMPGMNGRDLAEAIRSFKPGLRCLFMSGYAADVISNRSVIEGGLHFIQKPFKFADLAAKVAEAMA